GKWRLWCRGYGGGAAREEEWCRGSIRSGGGDHFWFWPEGSPENFSGDDGGRRVAGDCRGRLTGGWGGGGKWRLWCRGYGGGAAREGEWCRGSIRSVGGDHFWFWPEDSPKNFSGGGGGRRLARDGGGRLTGGWGGGGGIHYYTGKANVVADAPSRNERVKPKRVRAMNMTLQSCIKDRILTAQKEDVNESVRLQNGLDEMIEQKSDGTLYYLDRIWVPLKGDVRTLIMDEAHKSKLRTCVRDFGGSWDVHLPLVEFSYNNSYHSSVRCAPFEALYSRKCHSPIMWAEVGESQLIGLELVQETIEKISQIKDRLKATCDRQKSYADKRRKPLEFSVGPVAYILDFPEELNGVHDTFYVSNLKKCLADPILQVPLDEIRFDAKLNFIEVPVQILEREFKKLKRSRIAIVKVRWNLKRGPEFTWEREDKMKLKYPYLFSDILYRVDGDDFYENYGEL
nr:hypothetical protein [Tanacetum cinerariifolium]